MRNILIITLILVGLTFTSCKKEGKECRDCRSNYPNTPIMYDTICDKTEVEINQWIINKLEIHYRTSGNMYAVIWCEPL